MMLRESAGYFFIKITTDSAGSGPAAVTSLGDFINKNRIIIGVTCFLISFLLFLKVLDLYKMGFSRNFIILIYVFIAFILFFVLELKFFF
jgi:hypothetical protein